MQAFLYAPSVRRHIPLHTPVPDFARGLSEAPPVLPGQRQLGQHLRVDTVEIIVRVVDIVPRHIHITFTGQQLPVNRRDVRQRRPHTAQSLQGGGIFLLIAVETRLHVGAD